jgi:hypothetical protein
MWKEKSQSELSGSAEAIVLMRRPEDRSVKLEHPAPASRVSEFEANGWVAVEVPAEPEHDAAADKGEE